MIKDKRKLQVATGAFLIGVIATVLIASGLAWVFPCVVFAMAAVNLINAFRTPPNDPDAGDGEALGVGA